MKKLLLLLIFSTTFVQAQQTDQVKDEEFYKENYEQKLQIIKQTQDIIVQVLIEIKERNFTRNEQAKKLTSEAMDELENAEKFKQAYLSYAKDEKWKKAFFSAESFWQKQVKAADLLLQARKILREE